MSVLLFAMSEPLPPAVPQISQDNPQCFSLFHPKELKYPAPRAEYTIDPKVRV
jgi:hypothetical protein